jgi:hypothetical protein
MTREEAITKLMGAQEYIDGAHRMLAREQMDKVLAELERSVLLRAKITASDVFERIYKAASKSGNQMLMREATIYQTVVEADFDALINPEGE